jgi:PucR C-terminal helix-turn-helix domain
MQTRARQNDRDLLTDLDSRREEIARTILARVRSIGLDDDPDTDYLEGLRLAVEAAVDHWIEACGRDQTLPLPLPEPLMAQARLAARRRVPLETVLRRYLAGHAVLGDYMVEEAVRLGVSPAMLRGVLRSSAAETDRVLAAISSTYAAEIAAPPGPSVRRRQAELVRRLLAGELVDPVVLDYPLDRTHVGVVVRPPAGVPVDHGFPPCSDTAHLAVLGGEGLLWGWFGRREHLSLDRIEPWAVSKLPVGSRIGIGEPAFGREGWRLTHDQARAALSVADRGPDPVVHYAEVAVLASALRDELLTRSLKELYVDRLDDGRGDVAVMKKTLRAFFEADRSVTSAAVALGVTRNTVTNRIRTVEERIGPLGPMRAAHLYLALCLNDLDSSEPQE